MPAVYDRETFERFITLVVSANRGLEAFEFDLLSYPYEDVKVALEQRGFSLHRHPSRKDVICAFRARTDTSPVKTSAA